MQRSVSMTRTNFAMVGFSCRQALTTLHLVSLKEFIPETTSGCSSRAWLIQVPFLA